LADGSNRLQQKRPDDSERLFGLDSYNTTGGRSTPLRIGIVLPVVVERGLVVVDVQVRDVVLVVPRAHMVADFLPYSPEIESGRHARSRLFPLN
jgi:hypothetical protein